MNKEVKEIVKVIETIAREADKDRSKSWRGGIDLDRVDSDTKQVLVEKIGDLEDAEDMLEEALMGSTEDQKNHERIFFALNLVRHYTE